MLQRKFRLRDRTGTLGKSSFLCIDSSLKPGGDRLAGDCKAKMVTAKNGNYLDCQLHVEPHNQVVKIIDKCDAMQIVAAQTLGIVAALTTRKLLFGPRR
jgi:hypothetical protein